jgi:hypothetical protein
MDSIDARLSPSKNGERQDSMLFRFRHKSFPPPRRVDSSFSTEPVGESDESNALNRAGWFESSIDLMQGLEVREGLPSDASLDEWPDLP